LKSKVSKRYWER